MGTFVLEPPLYSVSVLTRTFLHFFLLQARSTGLVMRERACDITGSRRNKANAISKSNVHTRKFQMVNLQTRKLWWPEGDRFVRLRVSARTLKTIKKYGLHETAKKNDIDLRQFVIVQDTPPGTMPNVRPAWERSRV